MKKEIYLDGAANTPLDRKVFKKMKPFLKQSFVGNSFAIHSFGIKAMVAIENARQTIADALKVEDQEVFFTSGATEANNWVLQSVCRKAMLESNKCHIIVSEIEHSSIMNTCKLLEKEGVEISYIKVNSEGKITMNAVKKLLRPDTILVSVMAVNNELGTFNDINSISQIVYNNKTLMMVDCTQYLGYGGNNMEIGVGFPLVDFFTFSSHKLYGPTGVGCLIARYHNKLLPLICGGEQEQGLRGGTSNTAGIVGMGEALRLLRKQNLSSRYDKLYDYLLSSLEHEHLDIYLNAKPDHKNIISLNCSKIFDVEELASLLAMRGVACSAGSACQAESDGSFNPSHVLKAIQLNEKSIRNTIRISFTKFTTKKDIDYLIKILKVSSSKSS